MESSWCNAIQTSKDSSRMYQLFAFRMSTLCGFECIVLCLPYATNRALYCRFCVRVTHFLYSFLWIFLLLLCITFSNGSGCFNTFVLFETIYYIGAHNDNPFRSIQKWRWKGIEIVFTRCERSALVVKIDLMCKYIANRAKEIQQ